MNGVLLMTYGSPRTLQAEDVGSYLARVRGGRAPDAALTDEFTRRYRVIGGSPLVDITRRQAAGVERVTGLPAAAGMRFSEPTIARTLAALGHRGVTHVAAIVLSPQYSPLLMGGYEGAIAEAAAELGAAAPTWSIAGSWHLEPALVEGFGGRIRAAIERLPRGERETAPVLLTAHSLPLRVAQQEPDYLDQLRATASAIAESAGLAEGRWRFCWQSAGHEPGEWMKPDFADLMPELAGAGHRSVIIAPVQFLADHLEILYDVDVGAREQAERAGLRFERIDSLNDDPALLAALAAVAERTLALGVPA